MDDHPLSTIKPDEEEVTSAPGDDETSDYEDEEQTEKRIRLATYRAEEILNS